MKQTIKFLWHLKFFSGVFFFQKFNLHEKFFNAKMQIKILVGSFIDSKQKAQKAAVVLIIIFLVSGIILMYRGNDAVILGAEKKEGILTAEQIKLSFDSVGGRMITEAVKEGQKILRIRVIFFCSKII